MKCLLDTCAVVWAIAQPGKLSKKAAAILQEPDLEVFVSAISCAEIACASERGRIELDRHWRLWFRHFVERNGWTCLPIDLDVIEEAYSLPPKFHDDPADRIIAATARVHGLTILTADEKLLNYPHAKTAW